MVEEGCRMPTDSALEPNRFRTASRSYLEGRPPYSAALIQRVAQVCGLGLAARVLDLGCGPGQLARAFAPFVAEVIAIDPSRDMLAVARDATGPAVTNIVWREGSSYDLGPAVGRVRLTVMGRSFHWMDRADTLRRLDALTEPGGAVALFSDRYPEVAENAWRETYRAVADRHGTGDQKPRRARFRHESVMLDGPFPVLELFGAVDRRPLTVDMLAARLLSMSSTSREKIGDRADAMIDDLRASFAGAGPMQEVVVSEALVGWRPV
jgi:SAM-dependent methyltransferase